MHVFYSILIVAGSYPLFRAWQANRRASLLHAVYWAQTAWLAWAVALLAGEPLKPGLDPWRYVALCLTGAAGVAVLGARRPQVGAWNFVVLGLLAVMLLPLGEQLFLGTPALDGLRVLFLGATLVVGILNYVPTAAAFPAILFGCVCAGECAVLFNVGLVVEPRALGILHSGLLASIWLAYWIWRRPRAAILEINRLWLNFRDRYGLFWAQRVREQFNRGAAQATLPGLLHWHGWEGPPLTANQARELFDLLRALLKRFENV